MFLCQSTENRSDKSNKQETFISLFTKMCTAASNNMCTAASNNNKKIRLNFVYFSQNIYRGFIFIEALNT